MSAAAALSSSRRVEVKSEEYSKYAMICRQWEYRAHTRSIGYKPHAEKAEEIVRLTLFSLCCDFLARYLENHTLWKERKVEVELDDSKKTHLVSIFNGVFVSASPDEFEPFNSSSEEKLLDAIQASGSQYFESKKAPFTVELNEISPYSFGMGLIALRWLGVANNLATGMQVMGIESATPVLTIECFGVKKRFEGKDFDPKKNPYVQRCIDSHDMIKATALFLGDIKQRESLPHKAYEFTDNRGVFVGYLVLAEQKGYLEILHKAINPNLFEDSLYGITERHWIDKTIRVMADLAMRQTLHLGFEALYQECPESEVAFFETLGFIQCVTKSEKRAGKATMQITADQIRNRIPLRAPYVDKKK